MQILRAGDEPEISLKSVLSDFSCAEKCHECTWNGTCYWLSPMLF